MDRIKASKVSVQFKNTFDRVFAYVDYTLVRGYYTKHSERAKFEAKNEGVHLEVELSTREGWVTTLYLSNDIVYSFRIIETLDIKLYTVKLGINILVKMKTNSMLITLRIIP